MEANLPRTSTELSLHIQRSKRRQIETEDYPVGPHRRRVSEGPQAETTKCLWALLSLTELPS